MPKNYGFISKTVILDNFSELTSGGICFLDEFTTTISGHGILFNIRGMPFSCITISDVKKLNTSFARSLICG